MFQNIATSRLILRRLVQSDREALFQYRSDPEISRYQGWVPETLTDADQFIAARPPDPDQPGTWFQLAITLKDSGAMIGDAGLHFPADNPQQVEIGITLAGEYHRQGYAAEALKAVLDYLFVTLNKHRVYACIDPRNAGARTLVERSGLRLEAHFLQSLWFKGAWVDDMVYAVLREEWVHTTESFPQGL